MTPPDRLNKLLDANRALLDQISTLKWQHQQTEQQLRHTQSALVKTISDEEWTTEEQQAYDAAVVEMNAEVTGAQQRATTSE